MINDIALVMVGMLIGALGYFVIGWVTFDRTVHDLTREARAMRVQNEELRAILSALEQLVQSARDSLQHEGVGPVGPLAAPFDESIYSVAIERELSGRARAQALVDSGYLGSR